MNTELNFPRRLLAGLTALALLLMLALPVWAEGEETEKLPVSINSVEDLLQLVADCRLDSWSEDRTVDLNTDLDLTGVDFAGIPTFSGTFDGNSHTISGLSLVDDGSVTGFFRYIQADGVVHDLTIRGRSMPSGSRTTVGGIVGSNAGTLINCRFEGVASGASIVGGIAGTNLSSGTINNCTTTGSVYGAHFIGGIVGENHGAVINCGNDANVNTTVDQNEVDLSELTLNDLIGTENAADARLCRHCGATLPEGPQPVPLRLQHVAASRLCLLTATVSTAGLVLFLLLTLLFPAMQHGFHELAASVGVLLPKDGRLFGGAAFFFFLPSAALCAGLWLAWRAARKEEPVPLTAYRAFRAAAWMEFVLLTVLCLPLHLYLFPFHLPDFARSRVLSGYIGLLIIWAISLVYFCVSRRFLRALGWRTLREKQGPGPCSVMLGINVLLALAMVLGAFSGLFSESLFSGFFPLAFFDGLCRGGGRLLAVLSLLVWAAIRVLLALLLLRLWPLLQKPEK